jgi:hypothetical protein
MTSDDGSDLVLRFTISLVHTHQPAEQLALFKRFAIELEPFTVGEGFRPDYMRTLSAQIKHSIASLDA